MIIALDCSAILKLTVNRDFKLLVLCAINDTENANCYKINENKKNPDLEESCSKLNDNHWIFLNVLLHLSCKATTAKTLRL